MSRLVSKRNKPPDYPLIGLQIQWCGTFETGSKLQGRITSFERRNPNNSVADSSRGGSEIRALTPSPLTVCARLPSWSKSR
jgi:hypothetical protein